MKTLVKKIILWRAVKFISLVMAKIRVKHCKEALLEIDTITPRDVSQSWLKNRSLLDCVLSEFAGNGSSRTTHFLTASSEGWLIYSFDPCSSYFYMLCKWSGSTEALTRSLCSWVSPLVLAGCMQCSHYKRLQTWRKCFAWLTKWRDKRTGEAENNHQSKDN